MDTTTVGSHSPKVRYRKGVQLCYKLLREWQLKQGTLVSM
jgi:hypothetical protein